MGTVKRPRRVKWEPSAAQLNVLRLVHRSIVDALRVRNSVVIVDGYSRKTIDVLERVGLLERVRPSKRAGRWRVSMHYVQFGSCKLHHDCVESSAEPTAKYAKETLAQRCARETIARLVGR